MRMTTTGLTLTLALLAGATMAAERKGMTWGLVGHESRLGVDMVGCGGPLSPRCEPYVGDTSCTEARPLLCVRLDNSPRPNYKVWKDSGSLEDAFYRGWLEGHIATTLPVVGDTLTAPGPGDEPGNPDQICREAFGEGWRVAEFHDARYVSGMDKGRYYGNTSWNSPSPWPTRAGDTRQGGWNFLAYGHVRDDTRFWVRVNGEPANCWDR